MRDFQRSQQIAEERITPVDTGASLTSLLSSLQQQSQKSYLQNQIEEAQRAGALAGTNLDFKPVEGGSVAQKAFNQEALQTNKQFLASDVMLKIPQLAQNAINNHPNDSQLAFQEFKGASDNYSQQLLSEVPDENRPFIQNMLNHHIGRANMSFNSRILQDKRIQAEGQFTINDTAHANSVNDAIQSINFNMDKDEVQKQVDGAQALLAERIKGIKLAEEGGIIKPQVAQKASQQAILTFRENLYAKQYENALQHGNGAKFLENVQNAKIAGMDEFGKANLVSKLRKVGQSYVNANKNNAVYWNAQYKDYLKGLQDGGERDLTLENTYKSLNPNKSELADQQIQVAHFIGQQAESLKEASFDQQDRTLASLKPQRGEENFGVKSAIFNAVQKQIKSFNQQYNQDKVSTLMQNPSVVAALNKKAADDRSGFDFSILHNAGIKPNSADPLARLVAAQLVKGTSIDNVSVVTNPQAKSAADLLTTNLRSGNVQGALDLFSNWRQKYGQFYPIFMRNLQAQGGLPANATFLVGTSPNDPAVPQIESALTTSSSEFKKALSDAQWQDYTSQIQSGDSKFENLISTFQNYNSSNSAQYVQSMRQFVNHLTLAYMANNGMSAKDAYNQAVTFMDNKYQLTSIDGSNIRIPRRSIKPYVISDVQDFAKNFRKNVLPTMDIRIPEGFSKKVYFDNFIASGHWVNNPSNDGLVFVDNNGNLVKTKNGNLVSFKFEDTRGFDMNHPDFKSDEKDKVRRAILSGASMADLIGSN